MLPELVPEIVIFLELLIDVGLEPRKLLVARKMRLARWYASLSSGERGAPVATRYLEAKAALVVDNNVSKKANVRAYMNIVVVGVSAAIAEVAVAAEWIAAAKK